MRHTFRDVIEDTYYNDMHGALSDYIERNADRLDLSTYKVESPEHAEVSDFDVKTVRIQDKGGFAIEFDVVVSAEITITEHHRSDVESDEREQWFCLSCRGTLYDGLQDFVITDVSLYSKARFDKDGRLSDSLVPIIAKEPCFTMNFFSVRKGFFFLELITQTPDFPQLFASEMQYSSSLRPCPFPLKLPETQRQ